MEKAKNIISDVDVEKEVLNNADFFVGAAISKVSLLISEILGLFSPSTLVTPPTFAQEYE